MSREIGPYTHSPSPHLSYSLDGPQPHFVFQSMESYGRLDPNIVIETLEGPSSELVKTPIAIFGKTEPNAQMPNGGFKLMIWKDTMGKVLNYSLIVRAKASKEFEYRMSKYLNNKTSREKLDEVIKMYRLYPTCIISQDQGLQFRVGGAILFELNEEGDFVINPEPTNGSQPIKDGKWHGPPSLRYKANFDTPPYSFEFAPVFTAIAEKGWPMEKILIAGIELSSTNFISIRDGIRAIIEPNNGPIDEGYFRQFASPYIRSE